MSKHFLGCSKCDEVQLTKSGMATIPEGWLTLSLTVGCNRIYNRQVTISLCAECQAQSPLGEIEELARRAKTDEAEDALTSSIDDLAGAIRDEVTYQLENQ